MNKIQNIFNICPEAKTILKRVLDIQCQAYQHIPNIIRDGDAFLLSQFGSSEEEILKQSFDLANRYAQIYLYPQQLALLPAKELATLRNILWRMEDVWIPESPEGVSGAWEILLSLEEEKTPEVTVPLKIYKLKLERL